MSKRPKNLKLRTIGSPNDRHHVGLGLSATRMSGKGSGNGIKRSSNSGSFMGVTRLSHAGVFIGPSVEGSDKEYVKVISGEVTDRKPSFA